MLAMLFGGVFWGCDGPHMQSQSTAMWDVGADSGNCWESGGRDRSPVFSARENDLLGQNDPKQTKTGQNLPVVITD
jgi:hypothetical protein